MIPVLTWANNWDQWLLYHIAIFDGPTKTIFIDPSADVVDVQIDLYSAWKEWMIVSEQAGGATKWAAAFEASGGQPTSGGNSLGRTFFLINGWRIFLDHGVRFVGNLLTDTGDSPFILEEGVQLAISEVSTLVVERTGAVAAATLAEAVWDRAVADITTTGSIGELLLQVRDTRILLNTTVSAVTDSSNFTLQGAVGLPDGFYNDHFLQITNGSRFAVALIDTFRTDGSVTLVKPLSFTPSVSAQIFLLSQRFVGSGSVR